jgi:DNA-binding transcriptional ArsR family regulator
MNLEHNAKVFAALSDPVRLGLVHELRSRGQACGTDLSEALGISLSLVCHHAKVLAEAGLLTKAKTGTTAVYSLNEPNLKTTLTTLELA